MSGLILGIAMALPAFADVISTAPDSVAVTVYRDRPATAEQLREAGDDEGGEYGPRGLAMITETRTVDLPAGRTRIAFQGVADEIIPASARLGGLPGRQVERNFDYDLLDPGSLIERSVGQSVTLRRTNPKTGKVEEEPATLRSGPDGVVVVTSHGVEALGCGTGPQALVFDHLPEGLAAKPTLSAVADAPQAGRYKLTLSYLAVHIDWSADYVARIDPDGTTLDLTGWLTLSNRSGASFAGAPTDVVAGRLARVAPDLPDIQPKQVQTECWPMGTTSDFAREETVAGRLQAAPAPPMSMPIEKAANAVAETIVTGEKRRVETSQLGDYKLYSLVEPTSLAARQTKQIRFLHQRGVRFEKLYTVRVDAAPDGDDGAVQAAQAILSLENKPQDGLGLALPAGAVSFRQPQDLAGGREMYVGEDTVRDVPVGEPFELKAGLASDVTAQVRVVSDTTVGKDRERLAIEVTLTNAKPVPVTFEVRQATDRAGFRVVAEQTRHLLKNANAVWRVTIPANGAMVVRYSFEATE
jgi:hypothetical protein